MEMAAGRCRRPGNCGPSPPELYDYDLPRNLPGWEVDIFVLVSALAVTTFQEMDHRAATHAYKS